MKPVDLLLRLPKGFTAQLLWDAATKPFRRAPTGEPTFASVLHQGLGPAMSERISIIPICASSGRFLPRNWPSRSQRGGFQGSSIGKIVRKKFLGQVPGFKKPQTGGFFFPKKGFAQICDALRTKAEAPGAEFLLEASVTAIEHADGKVKAVRFRKGETETRIETDKIWSSLPITSLVSFMDPPAPRSCRQRQRPGSGFGA